MCAAPLVEPIARWYTILNYGVHSLMYPYFAARALGIKVPSKFAKFITTLQFAQMVFGFSVNMASMYYQRKFVLLLKIVYFFKNYLINVL